MIPRCLTIVICLAFIAAALTGCGETTTTTAANSDPVPKQQTKPTPPTVEECLEKPDTLEGIEQRDADFWRATFDSSTLMVRVNKMESAKAAKRAARQATEIQRAVGGVFFLAGPMKGAIPAAGDSDTLVQDTLDTAAKCLAQVE